MSIGGRMMRRLIDAAEFTESLVDQYCEDCSKCNGSCRHDELMKLVDTQPTAYDVDKVVEQLEKLKKQNPFINGIRDNSIEAAASRQTLDYAIEIVKAGVKYDN